MPKTEAHEALLGALQDATKERAATVSAAPNARAVAAVLFAHGLFLGICGLYGAASNGWVPKVMHSAYAGAGSCALLGACALLAVSGSRKLYMLGVHLGLLLQLIFAAVFAMQSVRSYGVPAQADRFPLFVLMCAGSVGALVAMRLFKPKKAEKAA